MSRRETIKALTVVWVAPTLVTVQLPAHAQTSVCTLLDVAGEWSLTVQGAVSGTEIYTLNSDRTGTYSGGNLAWNTENDLLIISINNAVIEMALSNNCSAASGTITAFSGAIGNISGSKN